MSELPLPVPTGLAVGLAPKEWRYTLVVIRPGEEVSPLGSPLLRNTRPEDSAYLTAPEVTNFPQIAA
jgi:hypothetical protein